MKSQDVKIKDFCYTCDQLVELDVKDIPPLPPPYDEWVDEPITEITAEKRAEVEASLDGVIGVRIPTPKTEEEKQELVEKFLNGLEKLFTKEDNWTFLQPLILSIDNCV